MFGDKAAVHYENVLQSVCCVHVCVHLCVYMYVYTCVCTPVCTCTFTCTLCTRRVSSAKSVFSVLTFTGSRLRRRSAGHPDWLMVIVVVCFIACCWCWSLIYH